MYIRQYLQQGWEREGECEGADEVGDVGRHVGRDGSGDESMKQDQGTGRCGSEGNGEVRLAIDTFGAFFLSLHDLDRSDIVIAPVSSHRAYSDQEYDYDHNHDDAHDQSARRERPEDLGVVWIRRTRSAPVVLHGNGNGCMLFNQVTAELGTEHGWPSRMNGRAPIELACFWPENSY